MNKFKSFFLFYSLIVTALPAQNRISVDDFTTLNTFEENSVTGINWMNDGKFYSALSDNKIIKYEIITGLPVETLLDGDGLSTAIVIDDYSFSADERKVLLQTESQSIYRRSFVATYF